MESRADRPVWLGRRGLVTGVVAGAVASGSGWVVSGCDSPASDADIDASRDVASAATSATPLREQAARQGLVFGSSLASWQLDPAYRALHGREAGLLLTEDDLLWSKLKPRPGAAEDYSGADRVVALAERHDQRVIGAHLVWDGGFGPGWRGVIRSLPHRKASALLLNVVAHEVDRYRGRVSAWVVANEVTSPSDSDANGLRTDVPWYDAIGPSYVGDAFHVAAGQDPGALLILNEFGFETVDPSGARAEPRRAAYRTALDQLLADDVPVQAVGLQAHLLADGFADRFDERGYRAFLADLADRGLPILVTELDVLDDGLPADRATRDQGVADVYRRYLDVALDEEAVKVVSAFGLTDRFTWLQEDQPRADGAPRRPLAFDRALRPTAAREAISAALRGAQVRTPLWT